MTHVSVATHAEAILEAGEGGAWSAGLPLMGSANQN